MQKAVEGRRSWVKYSLVVYDTLSVSELHPWTHWAVNIYCFIRFGFFVLMLCLSIKQTIHTSESSLFVDCSNTNGDGATRDRLESVLHTNGEKACEFQTTSEKAAS